MQAYSCMLCKKDNREFINICYKNGRNSAKDDILEICGNSVAPYLETDDLVCSKCMRVINNAAKLKRQVYEVLLDRGTNQQLPDKRSTKALNLRDLFSTPQDSGYEESAEDNLNALETSPPSSLGASSSPHNLMPTSPDNLLMIQSSIPFDQRSDTDMEEANNKYRYYERQTPILDREVQRVNFRGRRRARGHNWTRRKGSQRSRSRSVTNRSNSRDSKYSQTTAPSRASRGTTVSKKKELQKLSQSMQKKRILSDFLYQNDSLGQFTRAYLSRHEDVVDTDDDDDEFEYIEKPLNKTRYSSGLRSKLITEFQQFIFQCPVINCRLLGTLEEITTHRVTEHNEMALFWCEQCRFSYLSQEHLDKHKEQHNQNFLAYCIYCSEEFTNKKLYEDHLNEHIIHSFPCIYCDKFFLKKQLCDSHIREQHPGRKKKIKRIKPQSILDRIDKYPHGRDEANSRTSTNSSQEFVVKVLLQHGHPEDSNANNEEDPFDLNCEDSNNEHFSDVSDAPESDADVSSAAN